MISIPPRFKYRPVKAISESAATLPVVLGSGDMGSRGARLMFAAAAAVTLFAAATAAGSERAVRPVRVAAPVESEGQLVADGRSKLLVVQPYLSEGQGSISRVNLDGSLDSSFGVDGKVRVAGEDAAVTSDGMILVATTSHPHGGVGQDTKARVTRLLPDGGPDPSFGIDGHADVHFGLRYGYAEAVATAANGDILLAGIRVDYASSYGDESTLAIARLKPDGALDRSFGRGGIDILPSSGEIGAFDVAPTPSGGLVLEGGNDVETFLWKLNRNGSIDRHFGKGGLREIRARTEENGHHEEVSVAPGVAVLPSGKLMLAATGFRPRGPGGQFRVVAVRLRPDGQVDRPYGRDGWALVGGDPGWTLAAGSTLLPGGNFAVATSFESKAAKKHREFGAIAFRPNGHIDRRFGQGGRCRAQLGGRHEATTIADVGGHAVVGGDGYPGPWLLDCPQVSPH
jgi:uncharacterized delta-60 repeat protein